MQTRNGFYRRTEWRLVRPVPEKSWLLNLRVLNGDIVDPNTCDHPRPTFNGDIWFCKKCGEPVRDADERRQGEIEAFIW